VAKSDQLHDLQLEGTDEIELIDAAFFAGRWREMNRRSAESSDWATMCPVTAWLTPETGASFVCR
jgi:hypothetical protein